jgi:hypothetical protein
MIATCLAGTSILLIVALWLYLLPLLGLALTPLVLAGVLLAIAVMGMAGKRLATPKPVVTVAAPPPITLALEDAARIFSVNKLSALSAALVAGIVLAYSENASRKRR